MQILKSIVEFVALIGAGYLITYLQKKIGAENLSKYYAWVNIAVNAVEQMIGPGQGELKKQEVIKFITEKLGNKISEKDLNILIEAAVAEINKVLKDKGLQPAVAQTSTD